MINSLPKILFVISLSVLSACKGTVQPLEFPPVSAEDTIIGLYSINSNNALFIDGNLTIHTAKITKGCVEITTPFSYSLNSQLNNKKLTTLPQNAGFSTLLDNGMEISWHISNGNIDHLSLDSHRISGPLVLASLNIPLKKQTNPIIFCEQ